MVIHPKKTNEIRIYVDLKGLDASCVHKTFPTPLRDEAPKNMGRKEAYSFTDGFSGYH
jgi:hypothetical protein